MGKKGGWFSAVKKALSPEPKEKKDLKSTKSKRKWFGKHKESDLIPVSEETEPSGPPPVPVPVPAPAPAPVPVQVQAPVPIEDVKLNEPENEQSKHAYSVALATAVAAEAAVVAAQAAAEVVRLTSVSRFSGKTKEEMAVIKIQTAFRGYTARRALRALRGLVRLKSLVQGQSVKRQSGTTLKYMQTLARVQSQIRARRIRMSEENQALQRQLEQKRDRELENLRVALGEEWVDSTQSKEKLEAGLQSRQEAAMRRERALAYAFSHQQTLKNSSKSANPTFMDPNNPHWGWSWLERWMASRPWESRSTIDKDLNSNASVKSTASRAPSIAEISKSYYTRRDLNLDKPSPTGQKPSRPPSRQSPSTPPSKAPSVSSVTGNFKSASPKGSANWGGDDDSRSTFSIRSERYRRHSVAGSSVRDDESLASSPAIPSYMAPTKSAKAKSRVPSPLGVEQNDTPDNVSSVGSIKKRLTFPGTSPAAQRRHSDPPMVFITPMKDINVS